ncbi:MAG: hypothetical protein NVS4B11_04490 [Ktedonobacteraceae bacterium]
MTSRRLFGTTKKGYAVRILGIVAVLVFLVVTLLVSPRIPTHASANPGDLPTYMGSNAHTGFNSAETILNTSTVGGLKPLWKYQAGGSIDSQPVVVNSTIYWGSWDGNEHATDLTGKELWKTSLGTNTPPATPACIPTSAGVASTATVVPMAVNGATTVDFVGGGDDKFYALNAATGAVLWSVALGTPPSYMIWAGASVFNGNVYVGISSFGDCPLVPGKMFELSGTTGAILHSFQTTPNNCNGGGIWDAPTIDEANNTIYVSTGTLTLCGTYETMAYALLEFNATDLSLIHSWQVPQSQQQADSDFGSSPTLFTATINGAAHNMVGLLNKNGIYYAFDRTNISAGPVWEKTIAGQKYNIASSAWDGTSLYVGTAQTTINGNACPGSIQALDPATGTPRWQVCTPGKVDAAPTVIPGVVIVGSVTYLLALDASTGKQVFSYRDAAPGSTFWGSATIANGALYVGNADGNLFAFGLSGTPPPTTPPGPVSKTWYFAEGRVGAGFNQYLTLGNPDPQHDCTVNVVYNYVSDTGTPGSKTLTVTVPHASRVTQSVNHDLNIQPTQTPAASLSTSVNVTGPATCSGIVAERPMYFNYHGNTAGSDVLGATKLGQNFSFADVPTGGGYTSFLTILNPGTTAATVTATYYANGQQVGTHTTTVSAGARGTIFPTGTGLPQHVAAIVTSTQPVMVERPSYFSNINGGNAGTVSGAASVVGSPTLANDWLFAEGYTGTNFQENLVISNLDTTAKATANVSIKLEFANGTIKTATLPVNTLSQATFNVNATAGPNQAVSAEITSTGAKIIVQREMFFRDNLDNGTAVGGSDVIGQVGPASKSSYSFAEGYTNAGYGEWLTLQNPTATAETISVTLVNGDGHSYTQSFPVGPNTRATVSISQMVAQHLLVPGDGTPGYEVSMTVQTLNNGGVFVAERPMYFNTYLSHSLYPTQGGTDVIGYVGG